MKDNYAFLIPAGGKGSRLYPLTKDIPKPYLPIYFNNKNIIRFIDLPIIFCKKNNIPIYIALDYKKEKLKYLEKYHNVNVIYTDYDNLCFAILDCLNEMKKDNIKYYSVFASDFLIPINIIEYMINSINDKTDTIALCAKNNDYTNINIKSNNGTLDYYDGENVTDLTFHVGKVDKGLSTFNELANGNIKNLWEYLYPKNNKEDWKKAKLLLTDINHIDAGLPNTYYEVIYILNEDKIDSNGNIVFPGAKINKHSKNIIALPNSDSSNNVLENCIVPEDVKVLNYDDVLKINKDNKKYFKKIKIKDFI